ncbi:hypothetical protein C3941_11190 [Kaistia algarum]|uniref:hypothetical protein n=1 Tax=Kaistia algarum TaxID=2083279 RepID=UPI000CE8EDBF|nr:hypothetical protein [Kaistia algarum]MCX5514909.1 hypothetical protein [Kaistia algarum]PPE79660.1 hypothetical protein C3941_11190 [Kaistia algarum]
MEFRTIDAVTKRMIISVVTLAAAMSGASAQRADVTPVNPAQFKKLSCEQIAFRIRQLNVPIGNDSSTLAGLQRAQNPVLFFFTGFGSRNDDYNASLAHARGERNALIAVAVEKDCASKLLVPQR